MKSAKTVFTIAALLTAFSVYAQIDSAVLQQWRGQKYSMFIHFGAIYSQLGGVWEGQKISRGVSEQIQAHAGIYSDSYAQVANTFDPVHWNADSIALLAKNAGMRSIVITAKHHDGFAMFNTKTTGYNVVDATPYHRDIIKELSDACARHGLHFGVYFSLIDWHYPPAVPYSSHNADSITPAHHEFNKAQVTELLTHYGPISELWFDMGSMSVQQSKEMRDLVHRLQPDCLTAGRIGNDMGDFMVMGDNQEPDYIIGVPWQSPASFFSETWGYRSWQVRGSEDAKVKEKLSSLIHVASRGGNFLLNIGPRGDGSVVEFEKDVLLKIGAWLNKNGEAIYHTQADPFYVPFKWGSITCTGNRIFLHVMQQPENGRILLPGLKGKITGAYVLAENLPAKTEQTKEGVTVILPPAFTVQEEYKVIALEFKNGYTVPPPNIHVLKDSLVLNTANAFKYFSSSGVDYYSGYSSTIKERFSILPAANDNAAAALYYSPEEKGRSIDLTLGTNTQTLLLDNDEPVNINNAAASITFGNMYVSGPVYSGIDDLDGDVTNIDVSKPFTKNDAQPWKLQPWQPGSTYSLPAGWRTAYYILQEITAAEAGQQLVRITTGDGLMVLLNGQKIFTQNNLFKKDSMVHYLLLNLKAGKNQLVVKTFNMYKKQALIGINPGIAQVMYRKKLPPLPLKKNKFTEVFWQLHQPFTPHTDLDMPNLQLTITK